MAQYEEELQVCNSMVADITERLKAMNYPTKSQDFNNVVRNTLARMAVEKVIKVREEGQNKVYWSRLRDEEGPLLER